MKDQLRLKEIFPNPVTILEEGTLGARRDALNVLEVLNILNGDSGRTDVEQIEAAWVRVEALSGVDQVHAAAALNLLEAVFSVRDELALLASEKNVQKGLLRATAAGYVAGIAFMSHATAGSGIFNKAAAYRQLISKISGGGSSGGKASGKRRRDKADLWKATALTEAVKLDKGTGKSWTRSRLAAEIIYKLDLGLSLTQVENWLKDAAEQPNGPVGSRSRKRRG